MNKEAKSKSKLQSPNYLLNSFCSVTGSAMAAGVSHPFFLAERWIVLGKPFPKMTNPSAYFKGWHWVAAAFVPVYTTITLGRDVATHYFGDKWGPIGAGAGAVVSAPFMNGIEALGTFSQSGKYYGTGMPFEKIAREVKSQHGSEPFFRGLSANIIRNSSAVTGMVYSQPKVLNFIKEHTSFNNVVQNALSWGIVTGTFVPITQFFSNISMLMQADVIIKPNKSKWTSLGKATKKVVTTPKYWIKGAQPRAMKMFSLFEIGGYLTEKAQEGAKRLT